MAEGFQGGCEVGGLTPSFSHSPQDLLKGGPGTLGRVFSSGNTGQIPTPVGIGTQTFLRHLWTRSEACIQGQLCHSCVLDRDTYPVGHHVPLVKWEYSRLFT